jgi:arylsulfatase A-like enzyme
MRSKGTLYDRGMEITLLMRMPGTIEAGLRAGQLIQNIDVAPALLEAAGVTAPQRMQGRSFWPLLVGGSYEPHDALFQERNYHSDFDPMRAVRTRRHHYIRNFDPEAKRRWLPAEVTEVSEDPELKFVAIFPERTEPRPHEELYDVTADPVEKRNLAGDPSYADVLADLRGRLDDWMESVGDPLLNGPDAMPKPQQAARTG